MLELLLYLAQDAAPLTTRWGRALNPDAPLPEYPRPHMVREKWTNLNGQWEYAIQPRGDQRPQNWEGKIVVPFCVESTLSGVVRRVSGEQELWYRRTFRADCKPDQRLLLHFGAVDWECEVFVDGDSLGVHQGGYDPFSFELPKLAAGTDHELLVRVWDPSDSGPQPVGKQRVQNSGIWYTPVTGIWQTVWTEPVPRRNYIRSVRFTSPRQFGQCIWETFPPMEEAEKWFQMAVADIDLGAKQRIERDWIEWEDAETGEWLGSLSGDVGPDITWKMTNGLDHTLSIWSPENPAMNSVVLKLRNRQDYVDEVRCEFAYRTITIESDDSAHRRVFLNGNPIFLYGPLDQGWWPDGLYTAPSEEAMLFDLQTTKDLGFNLIRKHVKIEPERWYWNCERLGLMVWQDLPNPARAAQWYPWREPGEGSELEADAPQGAAFEKEMGSIVAANRWGCIVAWTLYNEAWGQWNTKRLTQRLRDMVTDCVVNSASGGNDFGTGDLRDEHAYPGPAMPPLEALRPVVLGEFGGLGLAVPGHLWRDEGNWGYRSHDDAEQLTRHYEELLANLRLLVARGLAGAIYTQTTDVEHEINGLLSYDRAVLKMDSARVLAANLALQLPPPHFESLLPDARDARRIWRWTTAAPNASWIGADFDDRKWDTGPGGFGTEGTPGTVVGSVWNTPDVWLRTDFESEACDLTDAALWLHHDEDVEVFLNGELLCSRAGYVTDYQLIPLPKLRLRQGRNSLAVHCRQTGGGQYVDLGLVRVIERED